MKVAIISGSVYGGAGIAAKRLHDSFLHLGVDTFMLTKKIHEPGHNIFSSDSYFESNFFSRFKSKLKQRYYFEIGSKKIRNIDNSFSLFSIPFGVHPLHLHPVIQNADIVNIHWSAGYLDYRTFFNHIKKPVVITLHDTFYMTGACHYPAECERYKSNCSSCPVADDEGKSAISGFFQIKEKATRRSNIGVVGISKWITERSMESSLLKQFHHTTIPNGLSPAFNLSSKRNRKVLKKELGLPENKICILFIGQNLNDPRKGSIYIEEILRTFNKSGIVFLMVGEGFEKSKSEFLINFGLIEEESQLLNIYQAVDFMIHPAVQDNFPNTVLEALFCGCPVVGFKIGGMPDMIKNQENGFLVDEISTMSLIHGIEKMIELLPLVDRDDISRKTKSKFSSSNQARKYIDFFKQLLK